MVRFVIGGVQIVLAILLAATISLAQPSSSPNISFTVSMSRPWTHLLEVEMRISVGANLNLPNETNLIMPVWTPGSYMVREFERHVQDFQATDASGRALPWEKANKNTWRINTGGARQWLAKYRVYANELTVRTNELDSDHAFWNNAALLMYPDGWLNKPSTLRVIPANDWKVATALPSVDGQPNTFRAENFDLLYDSPVEVSNFKQLDFQVRGVPHRIVIDGEGNYNSERMRADVQKIVETQIEMFGGVPYRDYTFFLHLRSNIGGGIEHANSTSLGFRRFGFATEAGHRSFLNLVSHEFFHLWNVKRIRPDVLGPFDYTKENYTRLLWVAEGITSYYGDLIMRRAGFISERAYLDNLAFNIRTVQNTPGRLAVSVEEASFDSWIKLYRPDENSVNSTISYYDKGELLGLLLDLEIRRRSNNAKSLDDVMRLLYREFYEKNRNYTPADFQKTCELMAGASLADFFSRYVRGREELDYNAGLGAAGLRLNTTGTGEVVQPERGFLGADLEGAGNILTVRTVRVGTPAYEQGLNAGDQIIAINGARVDRTTFDALIAAKRPGDTVRLAVFRDDSLRMFDIKLGGRVDVTFRIVQLPSVNDQQKRIYQAWLGGQ